MINWLLAESINEQDKILTSLLQHQLPRQTLKIGLKVSLLNILANAFVNVFHNILILRGGNVMIL